MIDKKLFGVRFAKLAKWFNRPIDDEIFKDFYEILSEELDDHEFEKACRLVIKHEKFFPAPQDLIDRIRGNIEQRALIEWKTEYARCSVVGKKAWDSLPPEEDIVAEVKYRRKAFLEAYQAFAYTASAEELELTPPVPILAGRPTPKHLEICDNEWRVETAIALAIQYKDFGFAKGKIEALRQSGHDAIAERMFEKFKEAIA
jgi:hypothetical protein